GVDVDGDTTPRLVVIADVLVHASPVRPHGVGEVVESRQMAFATPRRDPDRVDRLVAGNADHGRGGGDARVEVAVETGDVTALVELVRPCGEERLHRGRASFVRIVVRLEVEVDRCAAADPCAGGSVGRVVGRLRALGRRRCGVHAGV